MKSLAMALVIIVAFVMVPVVTMGQTYGTGSSTAPIEQPLVREGTIAVKMVEVLRLGNTDSEVEAANILVSAGIAPRNGWIADYPVTPDIADELREAVIDAANAGNLSMKKDEAALAFDGVLQDYGLLVKTDASGQPVEEQAAAYPDNTVINNYYYNEGPPVVTYYAPPPYYAHLYSWVPYPFWWWHFRFSGFFVLADFHRPFFVHNKVVLLSNHFFDHKTRKFVRFDHRNRFHDRFFVDRGKKIVNVNRTNIRVVGPTDVRRGAERVFIDRNRVRIDNSGRGSSRLDVDRGRGRSGGDDRRFDVDRSRGRSGSDFRRFDVDRSGGRSGGDIRRFDDRSRGRSGREAGIGNRSFTPSSADVRTIRRSGRDGNVGRTMERSFRPSFDGSGSSGRSGSITRGMDRSPRIFTPSRSGSSGGARMFSAPSGGDRMFRSSGSRGSGQSFGSGRGSSGGGRRR